MFTLWTECFKMGLRELYRHKLRSFLTMIGMIMGVSVVIICVSVVQGVKDSLIADIRKAGKNMILIGSRETKKTGPARGAAGGNLTRADVEAIQQECDAVSMVTAVQPGEFLAVSDTNNTVVAVTGAEQNYTLIRNWGVVEGRDFEPFDIVAPRRVCLVGQTALRELFGEVNAINRSVRIGRLTFKVVGVLEAKGVNPLNIDEDNTIVVPLPIMLRDLLGIQNPVAIFCSATSDAEVETAVEQITALFRQRHKLAETDEDDFKVTTLKEKEEQAISRRFRAIASA